MCHPSCAPGEIRMSGVQSSAYHHTQQTEVVQNPAGPKLLCELCREAASVFCQADEALLCASCDGKVHSANFLVSRHVRAVLCSVCCTDTLLRVCGARPSVIQVQCNQCCVNSNEQRLMPWSSVGHTGKPTPPLAVVCPQVMVGASLMQGTVEAPGPQCWVPEKIIRVVPDPLDSALRMRSNAATAQDTCMDSPVSVLSLEQIGQKRTRENSEASSPETPADVDQTSQHNAKRRRRDSRSDIESLSSDGKAVSSNSDDESSSTGSLETPTVESKRRRKVENVVPGLDAAHSDHSSSCSTHRQPATLGEQAAARLQRVLGRWQRELHLTGPDTCALAFHLFKRALRQLQPCTMATDALRITLATCLWIAVKLEDCQTSVPKASDVAKVAGVGAGRLAAVEVQLLTLLDWKMLDGWLKPGEFIC